LTFTFTVVALLVAMSVTPPRYGLHRDVK